MKFPFDVYLCALFSGWTVTFCALPLWRKWSYRSGLVDDPGHRKIHDSPISLAGGLAVVTGLLLPLVAAAAAVRAGVWLIGAPLSGSDETSAASLAPEIVRLFEYGMSARATQLCVILLGACAMVVLGWLDDRFELGPAVKFGGQLLIAGGVAAAGIRITLFVENPVFSYAITILWILTVTNAFNLMDNMNGLCAGLGAIGAWQFAIGAAMHGQYLVAALAFLSFGALTGFLPYNFPRATIFLGDAGSHLVGYLMAVLAILPHFYSIANPNVWSVFTPLLVLAVPLGDMVWVVLLRWRLGKPFYVGDTNHLSHRLVRRGSSPSKAVLLIWLLSAVIGSVGFF